MAIIRSDGLFNGDRLAACSNAAHLHWPFLYLASDGYGRLELNYYRITGLAFHRFNPPPSEADFWRFVCEYANVGLLFVYRAGSKLWGAWDTPAECLPRHKTVRDHQSPAPSEPQFTEWLKAVRNGGLVSHGFKPLTVGDFRRPSEITPQNVGEGAAELLLGKEKGLGVELVGSREKLLSAPDGANAPLRPRSHRKTQSEHPRFAEWYEAYPRKVKRRDADKAYRREIGDSEEKRARLMANTQERNRVEWGPMLERGEKKYIPHPATYLNKGLWLEEPEKAEGATTPAWEKEFLSGQG